MREYPSDRVDLRSDTVTQPTAAMREAMVNAAVGDDVLGDDQTVIQLQDMLAEMFFFYNTYLLRILILHY